MYSSTLALTSVLDRSGWSTRRPCPFTPGKETFYPLYRRLVGPQGQSERVRKISPPPPPGFDPRTINPVTSRYTDWVIPANLMVIVLLYIHVYTCIGPLYDRVDASHDLSIVTKYVKFWIVGIKDDRNSGFFCVSSNGLLNENPRSNDVI
jgi:hypothetical protein